MKIAIVGLRALGDTSGGVERHVHELALRLASKGHDISVFCRKKYNQFHEKIHEGVRLINRPALYSKHFEAISHTAICIPSVLTGYDIVHFHAMGPSLLSWAPRLTGRKVVVTVHGRDYLSGKWGSLASAVLRVGAWTSAVCPHATIVVSRQHELLYKEKYGKDTVYIPNGVSEPTLRPVNKLARFGIEGDDYVLFLGRLVPEKGAHYLIRAFRNVAPDGLKLLIVGGSSYSDQYERELVQASNGDSRIVFTGPLFGQEKDEAFTNCKLFVLPSDREGMPIVLLEAMSYGVPVLMSDIPQCREVIQEADETELGGPVVYTFSHGNVQELTEKLNEMLSFVYLFDLGKRAKEYILKTYDWNIITDKTLDSYNQLL